MDSSILLDLAVVWESFPITSRREFPEGEHIELHFISVQCTSGQEDKLKSGVKLSFNSY